MLHHLLLQLPMPSNLSSSKLLPEVLCNRVATTTETIGVLEIAKLVGGVVKTLQPGTECMPARSGQGIHTPYVRFTGVPLLEVGFIILM